MRRRFLNAATIGGESLDINNYLTIEALEDDLTVSQAPVHLLSILI